MSTRKELAIKHSFSKETIFRLKTYALVFQRTLQNSKNKITQFTDKEELLFESIISTSKSELWNEEDNAENWILTAGKIQNLRIAAGLIDGVEIPAGEVFSFWKYLGRPSRRNGYVIGREIREGCIVPSIAGGLCQLSNALYDAAIKAGFQILERHKHSKVVKGSLAEQDRDATVKWNYVDLRFCSNEGFRIEIEMDSDYLYVRFRGKPQNNPLFNLRYVPQIEASPLNDCYSCWNTDCYICNTKGKVSNTGVVTYILDEKWSEYEAYVNKNIKKQDFIIQPFSYGFLKVLKRKGEFWNIERGRNIFNNKAGLKRLLSFHQNKGKNVFSWQLKEDEKLVKALIRKIPIETTHLVVSQNLLPFLYKYYALAGRTYDVLMTRSSIKQLQFDLDVAYAKNSDSPTLSDFRAPDRIINLESKSLGNAMKIITPHRKIAAEFCNSEILEWNIKPLKFTILGEKVLFPASLLARKGAYEIRQLVKEIGFQLVVYGKATENPDFMDGIDFEYSQQNIFENIGLVILPAYAEHCPRLVLKAISQGIPVIVSDACGIERDTKIDVIPTGDYQALKEKVQQMLSCNIIDC